VNGQKIGFILALFLQATFVRFITVALDHALAKPGLPGESQHIAIEIAILCCLQRFRLCGEETESKRHCARRDDDILPEHMIS
jgi:hypothetical protein